jgi:hypothetical protein
MLGLWVMCKSNKDNCQNLFRWRDHKTWKSSQTLSRSKKEKALKLKKSCSKEMLVMSMREDSETPDEEMVTELQLRRRRCGVLNVFGMLSQPCDRHVVDG